MTPTQVIGYTMLQTTAITAICSTRINLGNRPTGVVTPCINFFPLPSTRNNGFESIPFSINCRASAPETALNLAREVVNLFHGTSSTGIYGNMNNFEITRCSLRQQQGLIFEPTEKVYNVPVDILLFCPSSSVT